MNTQQQIEAYITSQPEPKRGEMRQLHAFIYKLFPDSRLWFLDGRNETGKVVSNPNIGYGSYNIRNADGKTREFYQVGLSANSTGISVYVMGLEDKKYLARAYGKKIGKASVSGYCIKFKSLTDINMEVLEDAIRYGVRSTNQLN